MASGGNGHSRKIDPQVALAYYLALPAESRSFRVVAERFQVSRQRVSQIAATHDWRKLADEAEAEEDRAILLEARKAIRARGRDRAQRILRTLDLYDRANDLALELLPIDAKGEIDLKALGKDGLPPLERLLATMPGLFKMAELAAGEATDRVAIAEVQPVLVAFARIAIVHALPAERDVVLRELEAASAGLVALEA